MSRPKQPDGPKYERSVWARGGFDYPSVYLDRVDITDAHQHAQKPYVLTTVDVIPEIMTHVGLNLDDLRSLHRQLTDELARVATGGRWPGGRR